MTEMHLASVYDTQVPRRSGDAPKIKISKQFQHSLKCFASLDLLNRLLTVN